MGKQEMDRVMSSWNRRLIHLLIILTTKSQSAVFRTIQNCFAVTAGSEYWSAVNNANSLAETHDWMHLIITHVQFTNEVRQARNIVHNYGLLVKINALRRHSFFFFLLITEERTLYQRYIYIRLI